MPQGRNSLAFGHSLEEKVLSILGPFLLIIAVRFPVVDLKNQITILFCLLVPYVLSSKNCLFFSQLLCFFFSQRVLVC